MCSSDLSTANANALTFSVSGPHQLARVAGYASLTDPGDFYSLGNLTAGTTIALGLTQPGSSALSGSLAVFKGGTLVTGATSPYTIPTGQDGAYYVRVTANSATAGLLSQYILSIDVADLLPPSVTGSNLPAEGATITGVYDRFTLTFSEDMTAAALNSSASYDLRAAGPDDTFDTGDDVLYTVTTRPAGDRKSVV